MMRLLTAAEAASQARISAQLLKQQISAGTGPAVTRLGRGHSRIFVQQDALDDWIRQRTTPATAAQQPATAPGVVLNGLPSPATAGQPLSGGA